MSPVISALVLNSLSLQIRKLKISVGWRNGPNAQVKYKNNGTFTKSQFYNSGCKAVIVPIGLLIQ